MIKKNVWLSIHSIQQFADCDTEHIDLMTAATLYQRNGKYFIAYEESELTGLEGTRTTVKLDGQNVTVIRTGTFPSHMLFAEDTRHISAYPSPLGMEMTVTTHTSRVRSQIDENGGMVMIDYSIELDGSLYGEHHFEMYIATMPLANAQAKPENKRRVKEIEMEQKCI